MAEKLRKKVAMEQNHASRTETEAVIQQTSRSELQTVLHPSRYSSVR